MQTKILITDPISDLGLEKLKDAGFDVINKPGISADETHSLLSDIDGWIIRSGTQIDKNFIEDAKKLQIIGRAGVGTDNIDIGEATKHGIIVMNVPDGNTISAAEHTMAMILSLSRNIQLGHMGMIEGMEGGHLSDVKYEMFTDDVDWKTVQKLSRENLTIGQLNSKLFLPARDEKIVEEVNEKWLRLSKPKMITFARTKKHAQKHGNNRIPYRTLPECIASKPTHKIVKDKVALFGGNHRHSLFFNHPDKNLIPDSFT